MQIYVYLWKITNLSVKTLSIKEYFEKVISLTSSVLPEEYKLTWKEVQFLTECCYYNYSGGDLNNFTKLSNYFLDIKFFKSKSDCSVYKTKIANKRWASSGRDLFELPPDLNITRRGDLVFNIGLKYDSSKESFVNVD